ncbi:unnamed protein product [Diplocarpon coronariae]
MDLNFPSSAEWERLNATVGGRLIETVLLASPCRDPTYDAALCAGYQSQWQVPSAHMESFSYVMAPFFAHQSCDAFTDNTFPYTLGNYVTYSLNTTFERHVQAALLFAQNHSIRFVVRSTSHDGKAIKIGAGVQGCEAVAISQASNLVFVSGQCPTVGIAGVFTQSGGDLAPSTSLGFAADQALSYDVVLASGKLLTATRTSYHDLYWALSGGGGGLSALLSLLLQRRTLRQQCFQCSLVGSRSTLVHPTLTTPWNFKAPRANMVALQDKMTKVSMPRTGCRREAMMSMLFHESGLAPVEPAHPRA